jgi:hypothetical protein
MPRVLVEYDPGYALPRCERAARNLFGEAMP